MFKILALVLVSIRFEAAFAVPLAAYSSTRSNVRIVRRVESPIESSSPAVDSQHNSAPRATAGKSPVSVFIVTTPDETHVTMLKNLLCSLFTSAGRSAQEQDITVMLHPGNTVARMGSDDLQNMLRALGYSRLSVLDAESTFQDHPHWESLKNGFPSNLRVLGIRHVLSSLAPDSHLLVIDEDVVCSPERIVNTAEGGSDQLSVPDEIVRRAPAGASVVCAHEIPGVPDTFNNGFCLYKATAEADKVLDLVEKKMIELNFPGDQTPFNQIASAMSSDTVSTFGAGSIGYLRSWDSTGFPYPGTKELQFVDSTAPDVLLQWSGSAPGPLCVHYLPFSPTTYLWSHLDRKC